MSSMSSLILGIDEEKAGIDELNTGEDTFHDVVPGQQTGHIAKNRQRPETVIKDKNSHSRTPESLRIRKVGRISCEDTKNDEVDECYNNLKTRTANVDPEVTVISEQFTPLYIRSGIAYTHLDNPPQYTDPRSNSPPLIRRREPDD